MEENIENLDSPNEEIETDDSTNVESEEVDVEAIKKENAELKKTNQELYERERKAKGFVRGTDGKWIKPEPKPVEESTKSDKHEYSLQDIRALSDVHDEDVEEVERIAKLYNITISEAKKLPLTQTLLKQKTEERTTAQATNTAVSRKGASKVSGDDLLDKFKQGDIPEKDEDLQKVIEARWTPKEK